MRLRDIFDFGPWQQDDLPEWFKFGVLIVTFGSMVWALIAHEFLGTTRVGPVPTSVYHITEAILLGVGVAVFLVTWAARVGGDRRAVYGVQAAVIWVASLAWVVYPAVNRHMEAAQFSGPGVQQWTSIVPLTWGQKYFTGGRGGRTRFMAIAKSGDQFEIARSDYMAMGGDGASGRFENDQSIDASRFCLSLQVQRAGQAMRILDHTPFNPGTVITCPAGAK